MPRVAILGLDSLTPDLVFSRFWADLPNFQALAAQGMAGPLTSCHPPITVPAWAAMVTGEDPGSLGVYGFRDRADHTYGQRHLASSLSFQQLPLWTRLSRAGKRCRVLGVPQTYPPRPINGYMVTGCLTPAPLPYATHPPDLAADLAETLHNEPLDLPNFRGLPPDALVASVYRRSQRLFNLAHRWLQEPDWEFFMLVDMGADRLQHGLWRYCIPDHPDFVPNSPHAPALRDYYTYLDGIIGTLAGVLRHNDVLLVVSDHGAQTMQGAVALNQWLVEAGYLVLRQAMPDKPTPFAPELVDWSRTQAWADGGYVGRIYLNVAGREPQGCVHPDEAKGLLHRLRGAITALPNPFGPAQHRLLIPSAIYRCQKGIAPDLLVYFGNLSVRVLASLGHATIYSRNNDTGPDGANHSQHGVVFLKDGRGARSNMASIYDIAPTVLDRLDVAIPTTMIGQVLH